MSLVLGPFTEVEGATDPFSEWFQFRYRMSPRGFGVMRERTDRGKESPSFYEESKDSGSWNRG